MNTNVTALSQSMKNTHAVGMECVLEGHYDITALDSETQEVKQYHFKNMLTEYLLNNVFGTMAGGGSAFYGCYLGSGNAAPTASTLFTGATSDTSLQLCNAYTSNNGNGNTQSAQNVSPYVWSYTFTYVFPFGFAGGGLNFAEIGIGNMGSIQAPAPLVSRALIKDVNGNPTTISASATTQLTCSYTLQYYPKITDTSSTITIGTQTYNVVARAANITQIQSAIYFTYAPSFGTGGAVVYNGALGALTTTPSGQNAYIQMNQIHFGSYSNNSLTLTGSVNMDQNTGNVDGGISAMALLLEYGPVTPFQFSFANTVDGSPIPKDNTNTLSISFSITWGVKP